MTERVAWNEAESDEAEPVDLEEIGHPKGTLAILAIYMLLFVVGWIGLYFFLFLARGASGL